ncbi:hypothetical protein PF011_g27635 [Phytophthora fragariae]|uniref:Uncharacterized protein n=1 Tax=Phytophthora fragariae TaxID=53985 RepID=A0A6A3HE36_9STRA|nr:hypothetical protein PF011_g27635 [Phytophthora fragariae]
MVEVSIKAVAMDARAVPPTGYEGQHEQLLEEAADDAPRVPGFTTEGKHDEAEEGRARVREGGGERAVDVEVLGSGFHGLRERSEGEEVAHERE